MVVSGYPSSQGLGKSYIRIFGLGQVGFSMSCLEIYVGAVKTSASRVNIRSCSFLLHPAYIRSSISNHRFTPTTFLTAHEKNQLCRLFIKIGDYTYPLLPTSKYFSLQYQNIISLFLKDQNALSILFQKIPTLIRQHREEQHFISRSPLLAFQVFCTHS